MIHAKRGESLYLRFAYSVSMMIPVASKVVGLDISGGTGENAI